VGLERLELVRTLQREFDQFSDPYRDSLYRLRERLVSDPTDWQRRDDLDRKLTQYRRAIASFLEEREPRFRDAGLPVAPLQELLEESLARWSRDRLGRPSQLDATRLRAFSPEAQAFLGSAVDASWKREAAAREVIFDDGMLEVARLNDPPRLALSGEIDASNAESVAEALAGEGRRVDQLSIDLSGVLFCDLAGLRAILGAAARLDGQSTLWLQRVPEQMARVMKLAELTPPPNLVVVPEESPW
jgi:anti-anti-sigma factor